MALNSGIQTYQILTNDDEVCIPSLSSILLAVLLISATITSSGGFYHAIWITRFYLVIFRDAMWYKIGPFNVAVWVVSRHQRSQYWASWLSRHLLQRRKLVVNWSRWRLAGYSYRAVGAVRTVGAMVPTYFDRSFNCVKSPNAYFIIQKIFINF